MGKKGRRKRSRNVPHKSTSTSIIQETILREIVVHAEGLNVMLFDMRRGNRASVCASERK